MHINVHDHSNQQNRVVATNGTLRKQKENPVMTVLLVLMGSFVLGSLPLVYGFNLTSSSTEVPTVPHEGVLWNGLGK
ncbi:MAG: hypothetical protein QNJ64_07525 [Crocosphaera sp.]|nr:hypothetical protein [Crocosphaera sp.]